MASRRLSWPPTALTYPDRELEKAVSDLKGWATEWLVNLVKEGGAHGPGSRRTISLTGETWSYLYPDDVEERLRELRRPAREGTPRKSGRHAATYERDWQGRSALWIDAIQYREGLPHQQVVLVQPYQKKFMGRTKAIGSVVEVSIA